jgi:hypothetical protein
MNGQSRGLSKVLRCVAAIVSLMGLRLAAGAATVSGFQILANPDAAWTRTTDLSTLMALLPGFNGFSSLEVDFAA